MGVPFLLINRSSLINVSHVVLLTCMCVHIVVFCRSLYDVIVVFVKSSIGQDLGICDSTVRIPELLNLLDKTVTRIGTTIFDTFYT